jgi:putative two-component system response regulator
MTIAANDNRRPRVLLVDACLGQRDLYELVLQDQLDIVVASRGEDALRIARDHQPDAIVLDVLMPGLNGWEVCDRLKADMATSEIPIILLTADDGEDVPARALRSGAAAVLAKPCPAARLLSTISASLHKADAATSMVTTGQPFPKFSLRTSQPTVNAGRILVVDDLVANRDHLTALLTSAGHVVSTARNGAEALELVSREQPDLIILDIMMPLMNGFETCEALKRQPSTRLIPVVLVTAMQETDAKIKGLEVGADDFLTRPVNPPELQARVRSLLRLKRHTDDLDSADAVIKSLALTIEARDGYTNGHCQRLAAYAGALGRAVGLGDDEIAALECGGYLHDIGKVGIPDAVLLKPGPLTEAEYELMKQHTVIGDQLCGGLRSVQRARPIVRHHHERLDGSGYPDRLSGNDIPLLAQIMSIVDVFDAATTSRPYKPAVPAARVSAELTDEVSRGWRRSDLVEAFLALSSTDRLPQFNASGGVIR